MEANFEEQSLDLSAVISEFGQHPAIEKLINAVNKVQSENPQLTAKEILDYIARQQRQEMASLPSGHVQDNHHIETEGLYASNVLADTSFVYDTSCAPDMNQMMSNEPRVQTLQSSVKVEDHLQHLNLNSPGNSRSFTINLDDLRDDPLKEPPRQCAVKSKRRATGHNSIIAHDHQYSSSAFANSSTLDEPTQQAPESAGRVPLSQGLIYSSEEVLSFPDDQEHAISLHPQVSPEMEDIFKESRTSYLQDYHGNDSLGLDGDSSFQRATHPVTPLFPEDSYDSSARYMLPLVIDGLKEESLTLISVEYCSLVDVQKEDVDTLDFDDEINCKSHESSRAGTPADSKLHSPFSQVTYFDGAPTPSPNTPQSSNYDSMISPTPSRSSGYTNPSPLLSPSARSRSRNNSSGKQLGRPSRLSSSSSTSASREPRMSLVNLTEEERQARWRDQNNRASREYRMRKKGKLSELETEVHLLEENQQKKRRTLSNADKKLFLMKTLIAEAQKRGIISNMVLRPPQ